MGQEVSLPEIVFESIHGNQKKSLSLAEAVRAVVLLDDTAAPAVGIWDPDLPSLRIVQDKGNLEDGMEAFLPAGYTKTTLAAALGPWVPVLLLGEVQKHHWLWRRKGYRQLDYTMIVEKV